MDNLTTTINGTIPNSNFYGHICENTAITSTDYPWGFRMRTEQRYWVETRENKGQRFVLQTKNPKTGNWCKPKKSTYCPIVILGSNEKGHVHYNTVDVYRYNTVEKLEKVLSKHGDNLTEFQESRIKTMILAHGLLAEAKAKLEVK